MIKALDIENFRCYRSVSLKNLRTINVVVGENGSGKTALLEALFLAIGGGPELALRIHAWRGMQDEITVPTSDESFEALWLDLFHHFDKTADIKIRVTDPHREVRSLQIHYGGKRSYVLPLGGPVEPRTRLAPISFTYRLGKGKPETYSVELVPGQGMKIGAMPRVYPGAFLGPHSYRFTKNDADRFSLLSQSNREQLIVDAVREDFPLVENLSVEVPPGGQTVYAKVRSMRRKIPINLLSSGLGNYLAILLAIASSSEGVVMIDEIGAGIYHAALPKIWRRISEFAAGCGTQVFASTHSLECLRALLPVIEGHESDFCLLRTERDDGACTVRQFDGKTFASALAENFEVR